MISDPRVAAFVETHRLHSSIPVDLSVIYDLYDVQFLPFENRWFRGFIYREPDIALIGVNAHFDAHQRRAIIVHELVHDLVGDMNWLCAPSRDWWYRHVEDRAQHLAAQVLIPRTPFDEALKSGASLADLQHVFEVPLDLLKRRYQRLAPRQLQWCS